MQIISKDQTVNSDTVQGLKDFNSQSLTTHAKKGEQFVSMMPAIKKAFDFMGDDIVEISTENDALKNKTDAFDENWLEESKANLLKQVDNEKRAILIMSGMQKQMGKNFKKWHIFLRGLWESVFVNIVSKRNKVQDLNINQLKLEVHDSYKKDEKITTNFEAVNDEDVVNKGYLDEK